MRPEANPNKQYYAKFINAAITDNIKLRKKIQTNNKDI